MRRALFAVALGLAVAGGPGPRAQAQAPAQQVNPDSGESAEQFADRTAWWRDAKLGLFFNWGLPAVAADATDLDGERRDAGWLFSNKQMQVAEYERLAPRFRLDRFDADAWAEAAHDAGARYVIYPAKRHDGFCLWDSKLTTFDVVDATPFGRDPLRELAVACRRRGLRLGLYYSIMDWHHPDYLPRRSWEKDARPAAGARYDRYIDHVKGQLRELMTGYGDIAVLWFDGGWEHDADQNRAAEVVALVRSLRPEILINNRLGRHEDFDTPEDAAPPRGQPNGRLWEASVGLHAAGAYARDDDRWKSAEEVVRTLCDVAGKGGNLLLGVGPTAEGDFPAEAAERLSALGRWLHVNGESIYGTTHGPFRRPPFDGRATTRGASLYLHVFRWPAEGVALPGLKTPVLRARSLVDGEPLAVTVGELGRTVIPAPLRTDPAATVVELRLAGPPDVEGTALIARAGPDGRFVLGAGDADLEGPTIRLRSSGDGPPVVGDWASPRDVVSWEIDALEAESYRVEVEYACPESAAGSPFVVAASPAGDYLEGNVESTGGPDRFRIVTLPGVLRLVPGRHTLRITAREVPHGIVMTLRRLTLRRSP